MGGASGFAVSWLSGWDCYGGDGLNYFIRHTFSCIVSGDGFRCSSAVGEIS